MKTGTTSIQKSLQLNSAFLNENGFSYAHGVHRNLEQFEQSFAVAKKNSQSLIISDEGIWHFLLTHKNRKILEQIYLNASQFLGDDGKMSIIMYFRRPDNFLQSWYFQGLKSCTGNPIFKEFNRSAFVKSGLNFLEKLKILENIFKDAKLIVRPYEKTQLFNQDVVLDFCKILNLVGGRALPQSPAHENVSKSDVNYYLMCAMLMYSVKKMGFDPTSPDIRNRIKAASQDSCLFSSAVTRQSIWNEEDLIDLRNQFVPIFKNIAQKYAPEGPASFFDNWGQSDQGSNNSLQPIFQEFLELDLQYKK